MRENIQPYVWRHGESESESGVKMAEESWLASQWRQSCGVSPRRRKSKILKAAQRKW
jgi:hypothetical protein